MNISASRIETILAEQGITKAKLAERCGISRQSIGFAVDPACLLRVAYDRKYETIYFIGEIYNRGMSNAQLAEEIKSRGYNDTYTICDSAEPKSVADLRANGIYSKMCYKRPGCVEYRVKWLQHRKIIIDPARTPNAYREFTSYSYATDRDGTFLSQLPDKDNHSIDAAGYSLDRVIWKYESSA